MNKINFKRYIALLSFGLVVISCSPALTPLAATKGVPESFDKKMDTTNTATMPWRTYFKDQNLYRQVLNCLLTHLTAIYFLILSEN